MLTKKCKWTLRIMSWLVGCFLGYIIGTILADAVGAEERAEAARARMLSTIKRAEKAELMLYMPTMGKSSSYTFSSEEWAKLKPHLEKLQRTTRSWIRWGGFQWSEKPFLCIVFHLPVFEKGFSGFAFFAGGENFWLTRESEAKKLSHWRTHRYYYYLPDEDYEAFFAAIPPQLLEAARSTSASQR